MIRFDSLLRPLRDLGRDRRGAALAEYGLLVSGITLMGLVAVSVLGEKVGGLIGATATAIPGVHPDSNAPVTVGPLVSTRVADPDGDGISQLTLDMVKIADTETQTYRLGNGLGFSGANDSGDGAHAASHLVQRASERNPAHGGGN